MESRLAARATLTLALPLAITAGHKNGRNHDLRVQPSRQRRLDTLHETLSKGNCDLPAQLRVDGAVRSQVRAALMKTRSATPRYVVPSMTAAAKRSGGEAGVTSRETASPVRT